MIIKAYKVELEWLGSIAEPTKEQLLRVIIMFLMV